MTSSAVKENLFWD